MTSQIWKRILLKCNYESSILLIILGLVRIMSCFLPQLSYLNEDEFSSALELPAYRQLRCKLEANKQELRDLNEEPIRSMLIPSLLTSLAFRLAPSTSAYSLLVAPRLSYTLLSFLVDFSLYKLCQYYSSRGLWHFPIALIFQTSFITLIILTRTLSCVPEMVIFSLLLVIVCRAIKPRFRIVFVTPNRKRPASERVKVSTQLTSSILVGVLTTMGTFTRPTFLVYAIVPLIYWTLESFKRNSINPILTLHRAIAPAALAAFLTTIVFSGYDTIYYRDIKTLMDIFELLIKFRLKKFLDALSADWILTPYNFLTQSSPSSPVNNLRPPYHNILINLPLAFNVLALLFYRKLGLFMTKVGLRKLAFSSHRIYSLMLITVVTTSVLLSFIPSQEIILLMPLIVPLVYAFGFKIYSSNIMLFLWLVANLSLGCFYLSLHEIGILKSVLDLDPILRSHASGLPRNEPANYHVLAFKTPKVPTHLWNLPVSDSRFHFDLKDNCITTTTTTFDETIELEKCIRTKFNRVFSHAESEVDVEHRIYILIPNLYAETLHDYYNKHLINRTKLTLEHRYEPHFGSHNVKESFNIIDKSGLSKWRLAFGLSLFRINLEATESRQAKTNEPKVESKEQVQVLEVAEGESNE